MDRRRLGREGPIVSPIGLGTMGVAWYGTPDDDEATATIRRALDLGIDLIDTSDVYASGHSEELVGQAIRGRRDQVVLATKFGNLLDENGAFAGVNGRPDYVKQACDASLRRLGVDMIDLYYQHRVDPETPIEETIGAVSELVATGKSTTSGCRRRASRRSGERTPPIRSPPSRRSTRSSRATSRIASCRQSASSGSASSPTARSGVRCSPGRSATSTPTSWR
jgi:aryl-alcohol dehydrogenase-like predicted oxidoreductase